MHAQTGLGGTRKAARHCLAQVFMTPLTGEFMRTSEPAVKPKRRGISKKTRFEVFKRDGFRCQYCGAHPPEVILHVDHITAVAIGGENDQDNLVTSCEPCNLGKGARPLSVSPQSLSDKAKMIAEREEQLLGYQAIAEARRNRIEDEVWRVLALLNGGRRVDSAPRDEYASVQRFIEALGLHEVLEAADIAMGASHSYKGPFRYFCGVCWNKIRSAKK